MPILSIIGLLINILFKLPSIISTISKIMKLLPRFKDGGLMNDLEVIGDILKLVLGIIPVDKVLAKDSMKTLLKHMQYPEVSEGSMGLVKFKDELKEKCDGLTCPADTLN